MKSPFPGMDPYLEQHWLDVHHRLTKYACDQLQRKLPGDLRARLEERVFVESDGDGQYRGIHPDVRIIEHPHCAGRAGAQPEGDVATVEPIVVRIADDPMSQAYIEIIDASSGNRVVTVIEFVSPSNKIPGEGRELYLRKQREVMSGEGKFRGGRPDSHWTALVGGKDYRDSTAVLRNLYGLHYPRLEKVTEAAIYPLSLAQRACRQSASHFGHSDAEVR